MPCCFVRKCNSKLRLSRHDVDEYESKAKIHLFKVPNEPLQLTEWKKRLGDTLTSKHHLCSRHFDDKHIVKSFEYRVNGEKVIEERKRWRLTEDAVPVPLYLESPREFENATCTIQASDSPKSIVTYSKKMKKDCLLLDSPKSLSSLCNNEVKGCEVLQADIDPRLCHLQKKPRISVGAETVNFQGLPMNNEVQACDSLNAEIDPRLCHVQEKLCTNITADISGDFQCLPINNEVQACNSVETDLRLCHVQKKPRKQRTETSGIHDCGQMDSRTSVNAEKLQSVLDKSKSNAYLVITLKKRVKEKNKLVLQLRSKIKLLEQEKHAMIKEKLEIQQLPQKQQDILKEALNNVKRKTTGKRYSKEWILDSLLLKIKSTKMYEFLRDNEFLPLPSVVSRLHFIFRNINRTRESRLKKKNLSKSAKLT